MRQQEFKEKLIKRLEEKSFLTTIKTQVEGVAYPPYFEYNIHDVVKIDDVKETVNELIEEMKAGET